MASTMIHMAVANEVNKKIHRNLDKLLLGSIAPDISKQIGETKKKSHFLEEDHSNIPQIDKFLDKYKDNLNDDFVMGYFIHLYTDYLWYKYFMTEIYDHKDHIIKKMDGTYVKCSGRMLSLYIYNDYTDMNIKLLEEYDLDLHIFYNDIPKMENIIKEIPMKKLNIIVDNASIIIEKSKEHKTLIFNIDQIKKFIDTSTELTISKLNEILSK